MDFSDQKSVIQNPGKGSAAICRREFIKISAIGVAGLWGWHATGEAQTIKKGGKKMYTAKDYSKLIGMEGFSENLLKIHFGLYQGYVTNTNKVLDTVAQLLKEDKTGTPEWAELHRRLGWEFNGMRLHEYYFENLGGRGQLNKDSKLGKKLSEDFGNYGNWEKAFRMVGSMRGIGWAALYQDTSNGRLINFWINEHDTGHPAGGNPILIMDVFEHAYMPDYGTKRVDYISAFFKNVNWAVVEGRMR